MAEKTKQKAWRTVLTLITIAALIILIIALRHQILSTLQNLRKVNLYILLLVIPIEIINYDAQTRMYEVSLKILKHKLSYWFLYRLSLELNFVQTIFPSGGISGVSYMNLRLRPKGVSGAQATLLQLMKLMMVFGSFIFLLVIGVFALAIGGRANELVLLIATSIITLTVVISVAMIFIIGSERRIDAVFTYLTRLINHFIHIFRPNVSETINIEKVRHVFVELHQNYLIFRGDYRKLIPPLLSALMANLTEVLSIYVVYVAFGHFENPGAIILAYAVANIAGTISILPGGIGVYETLMTLVLAAVGIPVSLSIPVTIMYRVVSISIQTIPGYGLYQHNLIPHTTE